MPLAGQFHGLNRLTAPAFLPPSESPDTIDAGHSADLLGLLGRRNGRRNVYANAYPLLGVSPFNLPGEHFRVTADNNGTWAVVAVPWPAAVAPSATIGAAASAALVALAANGRWDRISIAGLTASQTGIGTTNGTSKALSVTATVANYGILLLGANTGNIIGCSTPDNTTFARATLQLKINGFWTDFYSWDLGVTAYLLYDTQLYASGTGSLTDVRMKVQVTAGAGTVTATLDGDVFLVYGSEQTAITTA